MMDDTCPIKVLKCEPVWNPAIVEVLRENVVNRNVEPVRVVPYLATGVAP